MSSTEKANPNPGSDGTPSAAKTERETLVSAYRTMLLIRRAEEEAARAYAQGKIGGFLHLYIGQESVAVGAELAIRPSDYVVTTYRDHGVALARGMSARRMMAELWGKATGCSRGLGGSMHMFDAERGMLGGWGIVGAHIPIAAGAAFASRYRGDGKVTLCFFGDGAVSIAGFHEAVCLAALWKLPIVFICENNEYSMGTPLARTMAVEDVTARAPGYGIPSDRFEGHDVLHVAERLRVAADRARNESMPSLVEIKTYRFRGHSMSDPGKYRTPEEVEEHKKRDPLRVGQARLEKLGVPPNELDAIAKEVEAEVQDAVRFADESPEPDPSILAETTYDGPFAG